MATTPGQTLSAEKMRGFARAWNSSGTLNTCAGDALTRAINHKFSGTHASGSRSPYVRDPR